MSVIDQVGTEPAAPAPASRPMPRRGHPFGRYMLRRLGSGVLVIVLVAVTVFIVTRVASDPARTLAGPEATQEQYEAVRASLGLDQPLLAQFVDYVRDLAALDFGISYWQNVPVSGLIATFLPNTVLLVVVAILFAVLAGIPLGIAAALRPGSNADQGTAAFSLLGLSLPQFWLGAMLILLFAVTLGWLPTSGQGGIQHLILPAITLGLPSMGRIAQITRTTMIDELASQHILVARAKGLGGGYVVFRHALRNVMVPVTTIVSFETVYALAGYSVIVETVFAWPGVGALAIQAIQRQDLTLVQGIVFVIAVVVVLWNLLTDLVYRAIDPRIELR
mgnify:CR=1 FL=1